MSKTSKEQILMIDELRLVRRPRPRFAEYGSWRVSKQPTRIQCDGVCSTEFASHLYSLAKHKKNQ